MSFCWVTINVRDMEQSVSFYRDIIGLSVNRSMKPMPGTEIIFLGSGGTEVELICNEKNSDPTYGNDISLGFTVDSLEKTIGFLKDKNIPIHEGPFKPNPMIQFLYVLDPNGVRIQFVENAR